MKLLAVLAFAALAPGGGGGGRGQELPVRIRRIVLHVLGHPSYQEPERRFAFFSPPRTHALWKPRFGAHWIVWTDGTLWPRQLAPDRQPWRPAFDRPAEATDRVRLAVEATPVYAHVHRANSRTLGIELAHSGRSGDSFPSVQVRSLAWLLRTLLEMSRGRLGASAVVGHKDVDRRPAYARRSCQRPGCPVFVDAGGRPLPRRVDPPEALFARLREEGLALPRPPDGDEGLRRAERLPPGARPAIGK